MSLRIFPYFLSALLLFGGSVLKAGEAKTDRHAAWTLIAQPDRPDDLTVAAWTVRDFGAKGDGTSDDTVAFQDGLAAVAALGGGALYAPAGFYAIRGHLTVPSGVTLVGEWRAPSKATGVKGTVLQAYADRGEAAGTPFIGLAFCSGLRNLAIWYPEQKPDAIVPYPFTIKQLGSDNATVENVTLVNSYQGIQVGPEWNELHYLHNVYGSPLKLGFEFDFTTDIGRLENLVFSPACWAESRLPGAPTTGGAHATWMHANGTGMRMLRSDWEYAADITIAGYAVGFEIAGSKSGFPNAQFLRLDVRDCTTALLVQNAADYGLAFTRCRFTGSTHGFVASPQFSATAQFLDCTIAGGERAVLAQGTGTVLFQHCRLTGGTDLRQGAVSLLDSDLDGAAPQVQLGEGVTAATIAGNRSIGTPTVSDHSGGRFVRSDPAPLTLRRPPEFTLLDPRPPALPRRVLYVATDAPWKAARDGRDDATVAIQQALNAADTAGGGVVFLPAGEYALRGNLRVPSNVELRGVGEVAYHPMSRGSALLIYAGRGSEDGPAAITLDAQARLRGLTIHHPEQDNDPPTPYPFAIQGRGAGIAIVNVTGVNPYRFIDLASARCDQHYLDYVSGSPFMTGVKVGGGSHGGCVRNLQLNPHYFHRARVAKRPLPSATKKNEPIWEWQKGHLDALVLGDCSDELLFQNFVFGSLYGIHLLDEKGRGPSGICIGHGTDGSKVSARIDALGATGMDFINAELVCMSSTDKTYVLCGEGLTAEARFFNTLLWSDPDQTAVVKGGALLFSLANFCDYGGGFDVRSGGKLTVVGAHFRHGRTVLAGVASNTVVSITGSVLMDGVIMRDNAPVPASVVSRLNTQREASLPAGLNEISTLLAKRQQANGVQLREQDGEGRHAPVERSGRWGWAGDATTQAHYMYFQVRYPGFQSGNAAHVRVAIDYFDEGKGGLTVLYDASGGPWKAAGHLTLNDSRTWKHWEAEVNDAAFRSRCNGADIRLNIDAATPPALGALTITRLP